jgi:hypothetical protein
MAREGPHWAMPWWHDNREKIRQVVIMICSEQISSKFFCCCHPLVPILQRQSSLKSKVSLHWISGRSYQGGERIGPCHDGMTIKNKKASRHYDLQWTNIVWILLLPPPSSPHITDTSSSISKVSLHWISGWSWQKGERIEPCHDGMPIKKKYGKLSLWSAVNKHFLNSSIAATLLSPYYRAILINI